MKKKTGEADSESVCSGRQRVFIKLAICLGTEL